MLHSTRDRFRKVCPFLAGIVPKLEHINVDMQEAVRRASKGELELQAKPLSSNHSAFKLEKTFLSTLASASETSIAAVFPDLEHSKAVVVLDVFAEQPWDSALVRTKWAIELDQHSGEWTLWQEGSLKSGTQASGPTDLPELNAVVQGLREVGHVHQCDKLAHALSPSAELAVLNADEFSTSAMFHSHHHMEPHDEDEVVGYQAHGRNAIKNLCEQWAAHQSRHTTMQFVAPDAVFFRKVSEWWQPDAFDVMITGNVEMKTIFSPKVVHWPGAVRVLIAKESSTQDGPSKKMDGVVTSLKVYPLEATTIDTKWGWKYGSDGIQGLFKAMAIFGSVGACLSICCCLSGVAVSATLASTFSRICIRRSRQQTVAPTSARTPNLQQPQPQPQQQPTTTTARPSSIANEMTVPLRSSPLIPSPTASLAPTQ